jgi:DNA-binding transcriptional LysR family regulator
MRRLLDIDLRLLRIFQAIVESQGLRGAELVLNLSHSRISAGLAELERRLGVRLCKRGRSGFALTESGLTVYQASQDLFAAVDRFSNRAGLVSANVRRVLRLGTVDALVTNRTFPLACILLRFRQLTPGVHIDFSMAGPEELERQLIGGSRDLIILPSQNRRPEFDYTPLFAEQQSLYCAAGHPLFDADEKEISIRKLSAYAFVARSYLHSRDLKRIGHRGAEATVETMEAQLILILSGQFIGYLPAHYAQAWVDRGRLRCLRERKYSYGSRFFAARQKGSRANPLVRRFLSIVAGAVADAGWAAADVREPPALDRAASRGEIGGTSLGTS